MNVKATTVGFVMAGLVSAGAVTVLVVSQPAPVKQVQFVAPAADVATPTDTATVAPVVVTTTQAPAPVESTTAPAPVVAPKEAPVAVKSPAPAPAAGAQRQDQGNDPAFAGRYADGTPVKKDAIGNVIPLAP